MTTATKQQAAPAAKRRTAPTVLDLIPEAEAHLRSIRRSLSTIRSYRTAWERLAEAFPGVPVADITTRMLLDARADLESEDGTPLSANSINSIFAGWRCFFEFCDQHGPAGSTRSYIEVAPGASIKALPTIRRVMPVASWDEVAGMIECFIAPLTPDDGSLSAKQRLEALRDAAALALLGFQGIRVEEACALRRCDVDLHWPAPHGGDGREDYGKLTITGKGNTSEAKKVRVVPIDKRTARHLHEYTAALDAFRDSVDCPESPDPDPSDRVFIAKWHDPKAMLGTWVFRKSVADARGVLMEAMEREGREPRTDFAAVTPHSLRRGFATEWHRRGLAIEHIQKLMGHSKIETTLRYIYDDPEDVARAMRKAEAGK